MKDQRDESSSFPERLPERLIEGQGPTAETLRRFARQGWPTPSEAAAWERTVVRLVKSSRASRMKMGLAVLAGASAMGLLVALVGWPRLADRAVRPPSPQRAVAEPSPRALTPVPLRPAPLPSETVHEQFLSLQDGPVRLPAGTSRVNHHARITLSRGGQAHAASLSHGLTLVLEDGELGLDERMAQPHEGPVVVVAAPYRLVVLGAAFRVARTPTDVVISVDAGQLRVERDGATVAMVEAGRQWTGAVSVASASPPRMHTAKTPVLAGRVEAEAEAEVEAEAEAEAGEAKAGEVAQAASSPASPVLAPVASFARVARVASVPSCSTEGTSADLLRCLSRAAEGQTLSSEVALYQSAQVYQSSLHDPQGAVSILRQLRTRFPAGALRAEVSVSLAELLPQVGRYQEALAESDTALQLSPTSKRTAEVHLLRARILGVGLHDCARSQSEYQAAAHGGAPAIRAESQVELARCLRTGKDTSP